MFHNKKIKSVQHVLWYFLSSFPMALFSIAVPSCFARSLGNSQFCTLLSPLSNTGFSCKALLRAGIDDAVSLKFPSEALFCSSLRHYNTAQKAKRILFFLRELKSTNAALLSHNQKISAGLRALLSETTACAMWARKQNWIYCIRL